MYSFFHSPHPSNNLRYIEIKIKWDLFWHNGANRKYEEKNNNGTNSR